VFRGSGWRDRGWRGTHGGGAWHGGNGEQSRMRESREEGEKRPARFLTPRRSSGGGLRQQRSGEAAMATMTKVQW
jgi:hypothetical protein